MLLVSKSVHFLNLVYFVEPVWCCQLRHQPESAGLDKWEPYIMLPLQMLRLEGEPSLPSLPSKHDQSYNYI